MTRPAPLTLDRVHVAVNTAADMLTLTPDNELPILFMVNAVLAVLNDGATDLDDVLAIQWPDPDSRESIREALHDLGYLP